jgi:hypothetical protein
LRGRPRARRAGVRRRREPQRDVSILFSINSIPFKYNLNHLLSYNFKIK